MYLLIILHFTLDFDLELHLIAIVKQNLYIWSQMCIALHSHVNYINMHSHHHYNISGGYRC